MSKIAPAIPKMKTGLVVVTPAIIKNITVHKKYVVEGTEDGFIIIRNDLGRIASYSTYQFLEADLYFTMCLFSTMITLFKLGGKAYK